MTSEDTTARDRLLAEVPHAYFCVMDEGSDECRCLAVDVLDALLALPDDLAEVAGLTTHERAVAAYEEGRQWGERWTAEKIADAIETEADREAERGDNSAVGGLVTAATIARSFAGGEEET